MPILAVQEPSDFRVKVIGTEIFAPSDKYAKCITWIEVSITQSIFAFSDRQKVCCTKPDWMKSSLMASDERVGRACWAILFPYRFFCFPA
jgi:hypothetical protein